MSISDVSIRRPVLAIVISLLIIVFGIASLQRLSVRELPDVDAAVITVSVNYTGAAPAIVDTDIVEVIEGAVAGVSGIRTLSSSSRRGQGRTVIEFEPGRDIDEAANDVRDAVARVRSQLPDDADEPRIVKNDSDASPVMRIAITSTRMTPAEINDYAERFIIDRLSTLDGVASVTIFGERSYAVRIWLDRRAMAARNLTVSDVEDALRRNNVELPTGELTSDTRQIEVRLDSRLREVDQFRGIVLDTVDGFPIRLSDIARIERGVEDDQSMVRLDGKAAVGLGVIRQSQSNTVAISEAIRAEIAALTPTLPDGMEIKVASDDATFISASIREVVTALGISLVLVVLVIYAFLFSVRATLVPAVTIPVSLIGSFILINALGFSINVLTLLALILAIGLVVDDAIVMLENTQRRIELGETPLVASFLGARQVTFAILATSATLIAVFVPISFLEGEIGRLFVEFGLVMASTVVISTFVALSLCPALCSRVLKEGGHKNRFERAFQAMFDALARGYRRTLVVALRMPLVVILLGMAVAGSSVWLYERLPQELSPDEDRGVFFIPVTAPQGSTVTYTNTQIEAVERAVRALPEEAGVENVFAIVGMGGRAYRGFVVARMADWAERNLSPQDVTRRLMPELARIPGARAFARAPSGLGVRGSNSPLRVVIGGPDYDQVEAWAQQLVEIAETNPGIADLETDFEKNQAELSLTVDRARADDLGISVQTIAQTLQTMLASREITTYIEGGREYPVIVQAQADDRRSPFDLESIFVRARDGSLVPLDTLVTAGEGAGAPLLNRYDRLPSVTVSGSLVGDYRLGDAIEYMQQTAREILPAEASIGFAGPSRQFLDASSGIMITFALAVLIVFLVLAAQFESFIHPLIIMLTVPLGIAGALLALWINGGSLNIYSQIGIVLLVGLMAKNGILIVEFANQLRDEGMDVREAVIEASALRLRPIIMTVISTVLGAVPLVLASGAGAESRAAIGGVIIAGLSFSSILTIYLTPVLYDLLARYARPRGAIERELEGALSGIARVGGKAQEPHAG